MCKVFYITESTDPCNPADHVLVPDDQDRFVEYQKGDSYTHVTVNGIVDMVCMGDIDVSNDYHERIVQFSNVIKEMGL
jgi:hypothetical protein